MVAAAAFREGRLLVARRPDRPGEPGGFELPGGRVEAGETPEEALARELREELGVEAEVGSWLGRSRLPRGDGELVLDAWCVRIRRGAPTCRVHEALDWVGADALRDLPWLPADRALLPALAHVLRGAPAEHLPPDALLVAADWSGSARRRAAWLADPGPPAPRLAPLVLPGEGGIEFSSLLGASRRIGAGRPVLVGIDAVLGMPTRWAAAVGARDFADALALLASRGALERDRPRDAPFDPFRPFFRVPRGRGALSEFVRAAGGPGLFLRQVEQGIPASSCFAASGIPGAVGGATRALWLELAGHARAGDAGGTPSRPIRLRIWPFDGLLGRLLRAGTTVLAEIHPRALGHVALADGSESGRPPSGRLPALRKRDPSARAAAVARLRRAAWIRRHGVALRGLAAAARNEDAFDALLAAAGLLRLALEGRPATGAPVDPVIEGGILGLPPPGRPGRGSRAGRQPHAGP